MNGQFFLQFFILITLVGLLSGCAGEAEPMDEPIAKPTAEPIDEEPPFQGSRNIKWLRSSNPYGHTAIMIQAEEQVIYLDPVDLVNIDGLPKADIILITHEHGDHFSPETITKLSAETTRIVLLESLTEQFADFETIALAPGESVAVDGIQIEGVPAYNSSHPKALNYLGFVLTIGGARIYCTGDTALNPEMENLENIDLAVVNLRRIYSLSGEQVVKFTEIVKPKELIPIHWMPDDDTYKDQAEIEYLQQNLPVTTELIILDLH